MHYNTKPDRAVGLCHFVFLHFLKLRLAAAAAGAEQALVMRTVTAAAEQNDKRDDNDPNGAVVEQIAQTIHSIASLIYNGIADCKSLQNTIKSVFSVVPPLKKHLSNEPCESTPA